MCFVFYYYVSVWYSVSGETMCYVVCLMLLCCSLMLICCGGGGESISCVVFSYWPPLQFSSDGKGLYYPQRNWKSWGPSWGHWWREWRMATLPLLLFVSISPPSTDLSWSEFVVFPVSFIHHYVCSSYLSLFILWSMVPVSLPSVFCVLFLSSSFLSSFFPLDICFFFIVL